MKRIIPIAIFCILVMLVLPVSAGGDYVNKYVDNNPKYSVLPMSDYGNVEFFIRACGSAQDLNIWVAPVKANLTFDPKWYPDGMEIKDQNEGFLQVEVQPDCLSVPMILAAGEYTAYMQNGNGNQMEERTFKIGGGGTERVSFLGAAVTTAKNYCDHRYHVLKATYGADDECITVVGVPAHTKYAYWISDALAHTEYRYRDLMPGSCYPEVNHTERQISTWQIVTPATPASGVLAQSVCVERNQWGWCTDWDYELGHVHAHVHARHETIPSQIDFYYGVHPMHITGNWHDTAYMVTPATPAVWDWVVTTPWEDGVCGLDRTVQAAKCEERVVVDTQAYCDPGYWGDWSGWSDTPVDPIPKEREVETRFVPTDMYSGHYSEWSDTPEGSCLMLREDGIIQIPHDPCITRWVEATYKQECSDAMIDVTAEVQSVIDMGYLKFYFGNNDETDGIFAEGGEMLVAIEDPAPQYPKTAYINYEDRCGNSQRVKEYSVSGGEGVLFDLEAGTPGCPHIIKKS